MHKILFSLIIVGSLLVVLVPRFLPVIIVLYSVLLVFLLNRKQTIPPISSRTFWPDTVWPLIGLGLISAVSGLWAVKGLVAVEKGGLLLGLTILTVATYHFSKGVTVSQQRFIAQRVVGFYLIALLVLAADFLLAHSLSIAVMNTLPFIVGKKGVASLDSAGQIVRLHNSHFNNQAVTVNMILWPCLLFVSFWSNLRIRLLLSLGLMTLALIITFLSNSETAKLGLIAASCVYCLSCYWPHLTYRVLFVCWIVSVILVLPLIFISYQAGLQDSDFLQRSARDRIHIWHYTAKKAVTHPLIGYGVRSSREDLKNFTPPKQQSSAKKLYDRPSTHPHNFFLQIWYELGAIGAILLLISGLMILHMISRLAKTIQPYAYATFSVTTIVGAVGYGMWQTWLMAAVTWTVLLINFALHDRPSEQKTHL